MSFDDLVGDIEDPTEHERLRRVHDLLLSVDAPPELPRTPLEAPVIPLPQQRPQQGPQQRPRRRRYKTALLAAAFAAVFLGAGYLLSEWNDDVPVDRVITMSGVNEGRGASASIEVLPQDAEEDGNWPMRVLVRGLEPSKERTDYYELWLTKNGKPADTCGRFLVHPGLTTVIFTVPYGFRNYDGWVVTRRGSDEILLTT